MKFPVRRKSQDRAFTDALARGDALGVRGWVRPKESLRIGDMLGRGAFGTVYKATYDGETIVAKQIDPAKMKQSDASLMRNELTVWSTVDHPGCVRFRGVVFDDRSHYLLCEFMPGGSLSQRHERLRQREAPAPSASAWLADARQIAAAMAHLHSRLIVHRDLKSANVLLAADGRLCVGDFGLARVCDGRGDMTAETGSYRWMAPEVIRHEAYGMPADVYSFAILCWEMLTLRLPYPEKTPVEAALQVATRGLRPPLGENTPVEAAALLDTCWKQDAAARPSFERVCNLLDAAQAHERAKRGAGEALPGRASQLVRSDSREACASMLISMASSPCNIPAVPEHRAAALPSPGDVDLACKASPPSSKRIPSWHANGDASCRTRRRTPPCTDPTAIVFTM